MPIQHNVNTFYTSNYILRHLVGKQLCFALCIKVSIFVIHPSATVLLFSLGESGGSHCLSKAVIWHVSECVWANQTEGPL